MLRGFDVSHWQGAEDWSAMKAAHGISFGFVKATESLSFRDDRFDNNWPAIRAAGLVRGAYHFARPGDSGPAAQADFFVDYVDRFGGLDGSDLPVLDFETSGGLGTNAGLRWCNAWADRVRARTGLVPLVYFGSWAGDDDETASLRDHFCGWWYPRYPNAWANRAAWPDSYAGLTLPSPNRWGEPPDVWQYSQSFPVSGDPHDANVCRLTLAELRTLNTRTANGATTAMAVTTQEMDQIAARNADAMMAEPVNTTITTEDPTKTIPFKAAVESTRRLTHMGLTMGGEVKDLVLALTEKVDALVAAGPPVVNVDVDEEAIVAALTPVLQGLNQLSTETLQSIATAVNDELNARLQG